MEGLDRKARALLEKMIDGILENPKEREDIYSYVLSEQGIEPNLETILSFIMGFLTGVLQHFHITEYDRYLNPDEISELNELLKRRA